jgi:diphthamide synthase subunit DPH2
VKDKSLNISMRDVFISGLEKLAKKDKKIVLIVNDQGAPSLDSFKKIYQSNFIMLEYQSKTLLVLPLVLVLRVLSHTFIVLIHLSSIELSSILK